MQIFNVIIFSKLRTIQFKTVKPTYLCPLRARKLADKDKLVQLFSVVLYVARKRWLHRKFASFVLFHLIKKRSFNLLCVWDLFSEHWQSTLFQIFFFFWLSFIFFFFSWKMQEPKLRGEKVAICFIPLDWKATTTTKKHKFC